MNNNLLERVARFIAHYRTVVAESSLSAIDSFIHYYKSDDADYWDEEIQELEKLKLDSVISRAANDEEDRYQELLARNIIAQLLAIQGIEDVDIVVNDGEKSLQITLQAYYIYNGIIYDAGKWIWTVDMLSADDNSIGPDPSDNDFRSYILDDGTCFWADNAPFCGEPSKPFKDGSTYHPIYSDSIYGFCFGTSREEIENYLLTGEFVSAFQLISLCLHHVSYINSRFIPSSFDIAYDADIHKLAEYFNLSIADIAQIKDKHQALQRLETKTSTPEQPATPPDSDAD